MKKNLFSHVSCDEFHEIGTKYYFSMMYRTTVINFFVSLYEHTMQK